MFIKFWTTIENKKVGTIEYPLSSSSYTLSFEGSVPERFIYKDDNHFDMRAVPFAISDRGERVEGDAQTFLLKVEGCGCPDDNHPHAIDLGLPSGTKRSCCNVGASTPEEYGNYFAWDEGRFCKARNIFNCAENTNGRFVQNLPFVFVCMREFSLTLRGRGNCRRGCQLLPFRLLRWRGEHESLRRSQRVQASVCW